MNNLDGKSLLELSDEAIKNLGLNLGQRKKLIKYISYFKTLKVEPPKEPTISKESSLEEVVSYLIDIYGQHDRENLKNDNIHIKFLD